MAIYIIDSYIMAFYTNAGFQWEKRYTRFKRELKRNESMLDIGIGNISTHEMGFISIIAVCGALSIYKTVSFNYNNRELLFRMLFTIIFVLVSMVYIIRLRYEVRKQRSQYDGYWKKVKKMERHSV